MRINLAFFILILSLITSGCGQSGKLYLPCASTNTTHNNNG